MTTELMSANQHKLIGILFLYRKKKILLVFKAYTLFPDTVQPDMSEIDLVRTYSIDKIRKKKYVPHMSLVSYKVDALSGP